MCCKYCITAAHSIRYILGATSFAVLRFPLMFVLQLREYCLRLRNMVASGSTKAELSETMDTMIEEVSASYSPVTSVNALDHWEVIVNQFLLWPGGGAVCPHINCTTWARDVLYCWVGFSLAQQGKVAGHSHRFGSSRTGCKLTHWGQWCNIFFLLTVA